MGKGKLGYFRLPKQYPYILQGQKILAEKSLTVKKTDLTSFVVVIADDQRVPGTTIRVLFISVSYGRTRFTERGDSRMLWSIL